MVVGGLVGALLSCLFVLCSGLAGRSSRREKEGRRGEGKAWACFELVVGGTRTQRVGEPVVECVDCKVCVRVCGIEDQA